MPRRERQLVDLAAIKIDLKFLRTGCQSSRPGRSWRSDRSTLSRGSYGLVIAWIELFRRVCL